MIKNEFSDAIKSAFSTDHYKNKFAKIPDSFPLFDFTWVPRNTEKFCHLYRPFTVFRLPDP